MKISYKTIYDWYHKAIRNPKYRWWIVLATLFYLLNPFDISPDFLPIIGEIDDVAIASLLIVEVSQLAIESFKANKNTTIASNLDTAEKTNKTVEVDAVSID